MSVQVKKAISAWKKQVDMNVNCREKQLLLHS